MKRFLKYAIWAIGTLVVCRFIGSLALDSAFGPEYETTKRLKIGLREVVVALENGGATTNYATSFHILIPGSNPSTFNRVLVIPNDPSELTVSQKDDSIYVKVAGANQLQLETTQSFSGITFNLSFSEAVTE